MFQGNLFLPTEGIQKKVLGVLADSCRHMVVYALEKELFNIIMFTLKDDQMSNLTPAVDVNESIDCCKFTP